MTSQKIIPNPTQLEEALLESNSTSQLTPVERLKAQISDRLSEAVLKKGVSPTGDIQLEINWNILKDAGFEDGLQTALNASGWEVVHLDIGSGDEGEHNLHFSPPTITLRSISSEN